MTGIDAQSDNRLQAFIAIARRMTWSMPRGFPTLPWRSLQSKRAERAARAAGIESPERGARLAEDSRTARAQCAAPSARVPAASASFTASRVHLMNRVRGGSALLRPRVEGALLRAPARATVVPFHTRVLTAFFRWFRTVL